LADFRLEKAETTESLGENFFSGGIVRNGRQRTVCTCHREYAA
jgi:hypothetical protein